MTTFPEEDFIEQIACFPKIAELSFAAVKHQANKTASLRNIFNDVYGLEGEKFCQAYIEIVARMVTNIKPCREGLEHFDLLIEPVKTLVRHFLVFHSLNHSSVKNEIDFTLIAQFHQGNADLSELLDAPIANEYYTPGEFRVVFCSFIWTDSMFLNTSTVSDFLYWCAEVQSSHGEVKEVYRNTMLAVSDSLLQTPYDFSF